jgi:hypothetical protein
MRQFALFLEHGFSSCPDVPGYGPCMAGTAASVLWLFSQIGYVVFIVLMESMKTALGSFQSSILVLVALSLVAALMVSLITETGKRPIGMAEQ